MAKASRSCVQSVSLNDIEYDDEDDAIQVKYEEIDPSEIVGYENLVEEMKVEPEIDFDYLEEDQAVQGDDGSEFIITEIDESNMSELKPFDCNKPRASSSKNAKNYKYRCGICGKRFQYLRSYNQHRMVHTMRSDITVCEICHKELKRTALEYHMKYKHIEARNFQCEVCLNRFKSPGALRHHIATFHPRAGFDCDECERIFKTRELLMKHKDEEHVYKHVIIQKFDCEYCDKSFENQVQLTRHIGVLGKKLGKCRDTM